MKKITLLISLVLATYSINCFSALPGNKKKCEIATPLFCGGLTFGATTIYWQGSHRGLDYAVTFGNGDFTIISNPKAQAFNGPSYQFLDYKYDWNYKANIGYVFPCTALDLNLGYTYFRSTNHDSDSDLALPPFAFATAFLNGLFDVPTSVNSSAINLFFNVPLLALFSNPNFNLSTFNNLITGEASLNNTSWDLSLGKTINIGRDMRIHLFGGLRYSRLQNVLNTFYEVALSGNGTDTIIITESNSGNVVLDENLIAILNAQDTVHRSSRFEGIGPRFGFGISYHMNGGFGILGSVSSAVMMGEAQGSYAEQLIATEEVADPTALENAITFSFDQKNSVSIPIAYQHPSSTCLATNFDLKIATDWTHKFKNCHHSLLNIEVGYLVSHYMNVLERVALQVDNPTDTRDLLDASFDGPYIAMQITL